MSIKACLVLDVLLVVTLAWSVIWALEQSVKIALEKQWHQQAGPA